MADAKLVTVPDDTPLQDEIKPKAARLVTVPSETPLKDEDQRQKEADYAIEHPELAKAGVLSQPTLSDRFRHYVGSKIAALLPAVGGTVAGMAATPETGGLGTIPSAAAGAGLGSTLAEELKNEMPSLFGSRAKDIPDLLSKIGTDTVIQGAAPEIAGKMISAGVKPLVAKVLASKLVSSTSPAVRAGVDFTTKTADAQAGATLARSGRDIGNAAAQNAVSGATEQAMNAGTAAEQATASASRYTTNPISVIEQGAQKVPDLPPDPAQDFDAYAKYRGKPVLKTDPVNPIEDQLRTIKNTPPGGPQQVLLNKLHKDIISDPANFRNYISATGDTAGAETLAVNDVIRKGYNQGSNTIDPNKILDALSADKNNIYKEGIAPETQKNLTNFLTELQKTKEVAKAGEDAITSTTTNAAKVAKEGDASVAAADKAVQSVKPPESVLSWRRGKLALIVPAAVISSTLGGKAGAVAGGITGTILLKETAIAALMRNPQIAQLTTKALTVGLDNPASTPLAGTIIKALRGTGVIFKAANDPDGIEEHATVDENGQLQYAK